MDVAPVGTLAGDEARATQRADALDGDGHLRLVQRLRVLALGVARAGQERAVPAELFHQVVLAARRAEDVGLLLQALLDLDRLFLDRLEVPGERRPQVAHDVVPLALALLDLVQLLLHAGRELHVEHVREVRDQEPRDQHAQIGRLQGAPLALDVVALGDAGDDRRVCARPVDVLLLERLDQRCVGVARGRLREMLLGTHGALRRAVLRRLHERLARDAQRPALLELGQAAFFGLVVLVAAVDLEPAGEAKHAARSAQPQAARLDVHRGLVELRRRGLRRHRTLPDQVVELELLLAQVRPQRGRRALDRAGPDRLVRLLCALLAPIEVRLLGHVFVAVLLGEPAANLRQRLARESRCVGAHVGDEPDAALALELDALVELLRHLHGALAREAVAVARDLLERAGDERGHRPLPLRLHLDGDDACLRRAQLLCERRGLHAGRVAAQLATLELVVVHAHEPRREALARGRRVVHLERPVLLGHERPDLLLAVADHAQRDALHAPRGQPVFDRGPHERAHLVADQPVQHAPGLLRVHQVHVQVPRVQERLGHCALGDLVEREPAHRALDALQLRRQVPGDGLALAIGIRRQVHVGRMPRRHPDLRQHRLLAVDGLVLRLEVALDVHAELALRQVHDVAVGGQHHEILAEELRQGLGLGGRLHHDEVLAVRLFAKTRLDRGLVHRRLRHGGAARAGAGAGRDVVRIGRGPARRRADRLLGLVRGGAGTFRAHGWLPFRLAHLLRRRGPARGPGPVSARLPGRHADDLRGPCRLRTRAPHAPPPRGPGPPPPDARQTT